MTWDFGTIENGVGILDGWIEGFIVGTWEGSIVGFTVGFTVSLKKGKSLAAQKGKGTEYFLDSSLEMLLENVDKHTLCLVKSCRLYQLCHYNSNSATYWLQRLLHFLCCQKQLFARIAKKILFSPLVIIVRHQQYNLLRTPVAFNVLISPFVNLDRGIFIVHSKPFSSTSPGDRTSKISVFLR